jgi:PRTRC genetic system ThiF family protein
MPHFTPAELISRAVDIHLVGCGGNGSQMLTGLARLNHAITALGHRGLSVVVHDPDTVSEANIGRQLFSAADVGHYKAIVLTHRINAFFGLDWQAVPAPFQARHHHGDIVICCVDSARARKSIAASLRGDELPYLMDLGNRAADGQVVFGEWEPEHEDGTTHPAGHVPLPNPYKVLPELINTKIPEDDTPSCGLAEALERQELFINQAIVTPALSILWEFFRHGRLTWHGAFVNLRTGSMRPLYVPEPPPSKGAQ